MSHFTVLVIGENPEEQLAPFHEFECTGINDQYVQDIDKTEEAKEEYEQSDKKESFAEFIDGWYGWKPAIGEDDIEIDGRHKYGYVLMSKDGKEVIKCIDRTNPNRHWDWYVLGGRWTGFFKKLERRVIEVDSYGYPIRPTRFKTGKPGILTPAADYGFCDQALKRDIDFEFMRNEAQGKAEKEYDAAMKVIEGTEPHEPWSKIGPELKYTQEARDKYHSQPRVMAWKKADTEIFGHFSSADNFLCSRDKYISSARANAICTFAVIKDGQWFEKGRMGWWGMVSDEKEGLKWAEEFSSLIDGLSGDTLLSVYDCHI